jgi:uncharacterized repeat protein (TIGR03843 family)
MDGPTTAVERRAIDAALATGELTVVGRIVDASNLAILVDVAPAGGSDPMPTPLRAIYKPVRGERPLWDFPDGTLAGREAAAAVVAEATGYGIVPPTVLRDGPHGVGSVQLWIGDPFADDGAADPVVRVVPVGAVPPGWLSVIDGQLSDGSEVRVVHEDRADVRDAAVLDALLNNADRKGSHLVRDTRGTLWGFDHGLTFHHEPKLRTVLWGWAGQALRDTDRERIEALLSQLADPSSPILAALDQVLVARDVAALRARARTLLAHGIHPTPARGWPSIPWPAL